MARQRSKPTAVVRTNRDRPAATVRADVLKFDLAKDWENRGPARALFEDTAARAIEKLHGFVEGEDTRTFARKTGPKEGEIHIAGADGAARAALRQVIEECDTIHIVEHEILQPELDAAARVKAAWAEGNMLPPAREPAASEPTQSPRETWRVKPKPGRAVTVAAEVQHPDGRVGRIVRVLDGDRVEVEIIEPIADPTEAK